MNSTDPTNAQFAAYRAMWAYFNATLFGGALGHVILNFSRLARSLGFFAPEPRYLVIWRRHKWTILGLGLFLLLDLVVGLAAGVGGAQH